MALDTSFLVGNAPTPLLSPYQITAQKNALALQQQQLAEGQFDLQLKQQQYRDEMATRAAITRLYGADPMGSSAGAPGAPANAPGNALAPATNSVVTDSLGNPLPAAPAYNSQPGPAAAPSQPQAAPQVPPRPALPTMAQLIQSGVPATAASGILANFQKVSETAANIDKANADADKARNEANKLLAEQGAQMADGILQARNADGTLNPDVVKWHLQTFASHGPQYVATAQRVGTQLAQSNPQQQVAFLQSLTQVPDQMQANAKQAETNQAIADKKRADTISVLGAATNQTEWNRAIANADPATIQSLNIPMTFSPAAALAVRNQGMSGDQQVTAAQAATNAAETARHNQADERLQAIARGQEQQNIGLRQAEFNQKYGSANPLEGISDADLTRIKSIAAGDIPAPSPRSAGYQRTLDQVLAYDPTYTQARYQTVQDFKNKGDANTITSLGTAFAHLDRAQQNSQALGWSPAQSLNWTGAQHAYHQDVDFLAGEVGKFVKGGELTQGESENIIKNLNSDFQDVRDAGIRETRELMGGKFQSIRQKYANGTGKDLPLTMFTPAVQGSLVKNGFYAQPVSTPGAAAPAAAPGVPAAPKVDLSRVPTSTLLRALGQ